MFEKKSIQSLEEATRRWQEGPLKEHLQKKPERKKVFTTDVGTEIERVYTPVQLSQAGFDYDKDLGLPGEYPFTRGITPSMYRSEPFVIRAYAGFGSAEECNARYKRILEWGADEIVMAVDLPTQVGYDSDHIMAKGEVGKVGVAIDSLRDMEILFDGIPLNSLKRVSMLGNSFGPLALALFIALGEKQGLGTADYVVDLQNDVLKEYVARGTYIFPIRPSIRIATDVVAYCAQHAPHWYPMTLCVNHMNSAGAGSTKATAFALANGLCYIQHLLDKGHGIDEIAPLLTMFLDERAEFFVEIANFRATRRIWARLMRERFGAEDPRSMALKITAYSHGGETLAEPLNNITRISLAALAYVLGGVQSLYNASYDEVLGVPTEEAAKIAVRTQQILAHELGITDTVDPLGGSYFIESLTHRIEEDILATLTEVERLGGAVEAIETGFYVKAMSDGAIRRKREFDHGERVSVGANKFRSESGIPSGAFRIDPAIESRQVERLNQLRKERDGSQVTESLQNVREVAQGDENLVPPVLDAIRAYATLGEICDTLRDVFGEYQRREYFSST
jgi:methylmalonyl-CoA mutase N-terminal domain/subunit